jgi:GDP-4-dehydro-6-deoxy-D-mannose reductase
VFNLLGPGLQHRHLAAHLAGQLAEVKLGFAEPVLRAGTLSTTRDFVDVHEAAAAIRRMAERGLAGETYNVASGIETAGQAVLDTLLSASGLTERVQLQRLAPRGADLKRSFASIGKLRALGFEMTTSLEQSLRSMLDYYIVSVAGSCAGRA